MARLCQYCADPAVTVGMCSKHYQYQWAWMKKGPKRLSDHKEKLAVRAVILDNMGPRMAPSNVVHMDTHPKFKRKSATKQGRKQRRAAG